ncbi:nucleotidyltransferase [Ferrigenium sp. UT5]|uniref:nucleotidyltransferase n=1 Tax=Ferrigenium sp. UT5 TaxID=3242105 RepID=UPI003550CB49
MSDTARPATLADLKMLAKSLNDNGVDYLLIGGYALFAHGYERATTDIDLLVPATIEVGEKIKKALLVLPEKVAAEIDVSWFQQGGTIRVGDEIVVDLLFNAAGQTYDSLLKYQEIIDVDGMQIRTVSLEALLLTKQTVREKDVQDRLILERAIQYMNEHPNICPSCGMAPCICQSPHRG